MVLAREVAGSIATLVVALGLTACTSHAPRSDVPQPQGPAITQADINRFYMAHPDLVGREQCVVRAAKAADTHTWEALADAAHALCFPSSEWVRVDATRTGRAIFVDSTRIEIREEDTVTFWSMSDLFDKQADFLVERSVADCDRRMWKSVTLAYRVSGEYRDVESASANWESVLPGSIGEEVLNMVCEYRAKVLGKRVPPTQKAPRAKQSAPAVAPTPRPRNTGI